MSNTSSTSNKVNVPEARAALEQFKYEVANEIGVPLKKGYNGDLTSAQNGYVGGYMVKKMIEAQEKMMAEKKNSQAFRRKAIAEKEPLFGKMISPKGGFSFDRNYARENFKFHIDFFSLYKDFKNEYYGKLPF